MSRSILILATLALVWRPLASQTTGQVAGRVVDARTGAPIAGAELTVLDRRVVADDEGDFVILGLAPGRYTLTVRRIGFTPRALPLVIESGITLTLRIALEPGVVLQDIVVEAERAPLLTPDVAATRQTMTAEDLARAPIEDIRQALELRTGITDGHFRGGRLGQETYVVDGIDTRNQFAQTAGALAFEVAPSAIQEVSVFTSGFTADQASALSGVVNVVTRSGPPDRWIGRFEATGDEVAPRGLRRGYARFGASAGGPLVGDVTVFADAMLVARADRDPRVRGLTCLDVPDFACPAEQTLIPHQHGDRYLTFLKLDLPIGGGGLALSVQRNRDQHELYATRFKYALPDYLAERETATLVTLAGRGALQPMGSRALLVSGRIAWARIDQQVGVLAADQPGRLGYLQVRDYQFRGGDYVRGPVADQIAAGRPIPGYVQPTDSGLANPWGLWGADLFVTDGTAGIAQWSVLDQLQMRGDLQALISPQHDLKIGGEMKLMRVASYQHVAAGVPGAAPNFVRFYPRVAAAWFHNTLHAADLATIDIGVRLEAYQPRLAFPEDRENLSAPTASTAWQVLAHPRIGFALPLAVLGLDRASLRWTFGRFSQPPDFQFFFDQALDDSLNTALRRQGNPNLGFERATQYEAALDYLLANDLVVRATAFLKDLSGLTTSGIAAGSDRLFSNLDFGQVRGAEFRIEYRPAGPARLEAGYALQRARGTVSTPFDSLDPGSTNVEELEVPLQFDRRHAFNLQAFTVAAGWDLAVAASVASGTPVPGDATRRLPWSANVSARIGWTTPLGAQSRLRVFAEGRNLLNRPNLVASRADGTVAPSLAAIEARARAETENAVSIPRESPWYVPRLDVDGDQVLSPFEQTLARRGALLDAAEPTLLYGEARQVRVGVELTW